MKRIFRLLALAVYPVPYPFAAGWHALLGATLWWWIGYGATPDYSFGKVALGAGVGLVVGAALVLVLGKQLEDK